MARVLLAALVCVLGLQAFPAIVDAGAGWETAPVNGAILSAVGYGEGLYVAVGGNGAILTSLDAIQWTPRQSGTTEWLQGVAYGNGRFVAVGSGGTILTSEDGVTWRAREGGGGAFLTSVAYGDRGFVAVGEGPVIFTSPNGLDWSPATVPFGIGRLYGVAYGNGLYVAVGAASGGEGGGGVLCTSPDPDSVAWSVYDPSVCDPDGCFPLIGSLVAITYGGGQFVAVENGAGALTSPDGLTWTRRETGAEGQLRGVAYGGGQYVAVGMWLSEPPGDILTSADGVTWTPEPPPSGVEEDFVGAGYGGRFVVVGGSTVLASEQAPRAAGDTYTAGAGTLSVPQPGVLHNDTDPEDDPLTAEVVTGAVYGIVSLDVYGGFTYGPPLGFVGQDQFTYKASDGWLESDPATVTIDVDTLPPAWGDSKSLSATTVGETEVTLAWTPATDEAGVVAYAVYRNGNPVATVSGSVYSQSVTGLVPGTTYTFRVEAKDSRGNWSSDGPSVTVTTAAQTVPDTTPPTWPSRATLAALDVTGTSVVLTWPAAADDGGVVQYAVYRDGNPIDTVAGNVYTYTVTGLTPGTTYTFKVEARDGAGNWSSDGPSAEVTTAPAPSGRSRRSRDVTGGLCPSLPRVTCAIIDPSEGTLMGTLVMHEDVGEFALEIPGGAIDAPPGRTVRVLVRSLTPDEVARLWPETAPATYRPAAQGYEIRAEVLTAAGDGQVTDLAVPAVFWVRPSADGAARGIEPEKLGLFRLSGDGALAFAGGRLVDGLVAAELTRLGRYLLAGVNVSFADLEGHWARDEVELMAAKLVVQGFPGGSFGPDAGVTRAQFAAMLVRALGLTSTGSAGEPAAVPTVPSPADFTDVRPGDWFHPEVTAAARMGIAKGFDDGTFRPDDPVTREQAAAMVARALQVGSKVTPVSRTEVQRLLAGFADGGAVSAWAVEDLALAVREGILRGRPGPDGSVSTLAPQAGAGRAEAAVMIARLWRRL